MELKTKVQAENGKQELVITREFNLPVTLLFKAYEEPEFIAQWMGTNVLKMESAKHGGYQFETTDQNGNVTFKANGVHHEFIPNEKITRTFEMENAPFGVQLELLRFEPLTETTSRLTIHSIYESVQKRDKILQLPFAQGLNWAHNRLEEVMANK